MILVILTALTAVCVAEKLEKEYLPPVSVSPDLYLVGHGSNGDTTGNGGNSGKHGNDGNGGTRQDGQDNYSLQGIDGKTYTVSLATIEEAYKNLIPYLQENPSQTYPSFTPFFINLETINKTEATSNQLLKDSAYDLGSLDGLKHNNVWRNSYGRPIVHTGDVISNGNNVDLSDKVGGADDLGLQKQNTSGFHQFYYEQPKFRLDNTSQGAHTKFNSTGVEFGPLIFGLLNSGPFNSGPLNSESLNSGPLNSGPLNPGPLNSGPLNSGPLNSGPLNSGPLNSGLLNSGPLNSGPLNSRPLNSGPLNSGPLNSGPFNSGPLNSGPLNSAPLNSGPFNSGPLNSGPLNSGPNNLFLPPSKDILPPGRTTQGHSNQGDSGLIAGSDFNAFLIKLGKDLQKAYINKLKENNDPYYNGLQYGPFILYYYSRQPNYPAQQSFSPYNGIPQAALNPFTSQSIQFGSTPTEKFGQPSQPTTQFGSTDTHFGNLRFGQNQAPFGQPFIGQYPDYSQLLNQLYQGRNSHSNSPDWTSQQYQGSIGQSISPDSTLSSRDPKDSSSLILATLLKSNGKSDQSKDDAFRDTIKLISLLQSISSAKTK